MKTALAKINLKIYSPLDVLIHKLNKLLFGKKRANEIIFIKQGVQLRKRYFINGIWNFKGIKLPDYSHELSNWLMYQIYMDTLFTFCVHQDNYSSQLIDKLDQYLPEGTYCYKNNVINVTVEKDDVIIDAGAWIGDFSAYASIKGAVVYAFEPSKNTFIYLEKTKEINSNIHAINKGLGDKPGFEYLSIDLENSGKNSINHENENSEEIELTTLDKFVKDNKINKVDFIKADIEGFERNMIIGAKETLKRFGPKLAICTYHLPDDRDTIKRLILEANPNYIIVQKRNKLYAMAVNY